MRPLYPVLAVVALVLTAGWLGRGEAASVTAAPPTAPVQHTGPVTTHGDLAMQGLESDLVDAELRIAEKPNDVRPRLERANLVYLRARVTGDIDEMARALALTEECVRAYPSSADARIVHAVQAQTLHRFAEARADLAQARKLGADERRLAPLERELDWSAGLWGPASAAIREEARRTPSVGSVARLARLEHDLGRHDVADHLYRRALGLVTQRDPIPVAMLELQRGMNLVDAGLLQEAVATFRSASVRLPRYVAAKDHLAETLARLGRDAEAIAIYEEITKATSPDPEFVGALGALYRRKGRVAEADALRARATRRYEELLGRYPEAMAWHAAEFFGGEGGDPARARALLRMNVDLRPNAESLDALARLERAAGDAARADALERRAEAIRASVSDG